MIYTTTSAEETFLLGVKTGEEAMPGDVYLLNGDLGAGKTVFAKGFAKGLGITGDVTSPTFTILQIYESGRLPFYHFDIYRIEDTDELADLGCDEYLYGSGVCLIEWADKISEFTPDNSVTVEIMKDFDEGADVRRIEILRGGASGGEN